MHQYTFINKRYIKDKTINSAIDRACEQKYAINKFPFIILNMNIDPSHIDVNVHPSKLEVKFDDEAKVFDAIYYAVRTTIEKNNREASPFTNIASVENVDKVEQISKDLINHGMIKNVAIETPKKFDFSKASFKSTETPKEEVALEENIEIPKEEKKEEIFLPKDIPVKEEKAIVEDFHYEISEEIKKENELAENVEIKMENALPYRYIGQVFDTYIIIQIKETMYIIDQHAAHERLLYEQIKESYYAKDKQSQLLLIPVLVELTSKEMEIVSSNLEMFEQSGFMLEEFGDNAIKISGVPNIGYDIDYKSMFKDMIDELLGATKTEKKEKEFRFLATLACKAAVKGNMKLTEEEQIALIDKMVKLDNPFTCPHGRPTAYEITKYEIERRFLRK